MHPVSSTKGEHTVGRKKIMLTFYDFFCELIFKTLIWRITALLYKVYMFIAFCM